MLTQQPASLAANLERIDKMKTMKEAETEVMEGQECVQYAKTFLADARKDYPLKADQAALENLQTLFEANMDEQLFHKVFPEEMLGTILDRHGMSYKEFRTHLIPSCARKVRDMLNRQLSPTEADNISSERLMTCTDLCRAAEKAAIAPTL